MMLEMAKVRTCVCVWRGIVYKVQMGEAAKVEGTLARYILMGTVLYLTLSDWHE
jgi:hypothetical protein